MIRQVTSPDQGSRKRKLKSTLGELEITAQQAFKLGVVSHRQLSPHLENCCLLLSANVSYQQAEKDVSYLTGVSVPAKTQQRLVHRQVFATPEGSDPLDEISVDGGKVRLRTPKGEPCQWKDYKALASDLGIVATYQDNRTLIDWVHEQSLAIPLICLGDGHDGVWKIVQEISSSSQRQEILDWYHLVENLHKVGGSLKRLKQGETLLWQGKVDVAMASPAPEAHRAI